MAQGVSAAIINSLGLKMPIRVDPLCTSSPILSLLKPLLHSFLGSDGDMAVDTALSMSAFHPLLTKIITDVMSRFGWISGLDTGRQRG
jgi:hypothetical protein